jgi:cytochrome P450
LRAELAPLGADPDPDALARLPYLAATCEEALRIVPVVTINFRIVAQPFSLMGHALPVGVRIAPCLYLTHQHPDTYPEPRTFRPERFLERKFTPFEFVPYGGGPRRCVGAAFAELEMRVVLGTLLARFELRLLDERFRPVRRTVTISPGGGPRMRVERLVSH